jgi:hypothetical protein
VRLSFASQTTRISYPLPHHRSACLQVLVLLVLKLNERQHHFLQNGFDTPKIISDSR